MLHPLNPPSCIAELNEIIALQRRLLEYACTDSTYRDPDFQAYVETTFAGWLLARKHGDAKSDKVVRRFFQDLTALMKLPLADKQEALADFLRDQDYHLHLLDATYRFSFQRVKSTAHERAALCLTAFFDFLGIGYPPGVTTTTKGSVGFSKADVIAGYKDTNKYIEYVCPCCDSLLTDGPGANPEGYTLEHYFPKDIYPSICLHPLNLIPMCSGCNSRKGDHDPLEPPSTPPFRVPFDEAFHPLERPVRRYADLDFIPISSDREQMRFMAHAGGKTLDESIKAYGILYQIPERWHVLWKRVAWRIDSSVKRAILTLTRGGAKLDSTVFTEAISMAIDDLESNLGFEHFNYPAVRWLRWAKDHCFKRLCQDFGVS